MDWYPLLCQIAALRYELRAATYATLSAAAMADGKHREAGAFIARMESSQADADRVSKGGKA